MQYYFLMMIVKWYNWYIYIHYRYQTTKVTLDWENTTILGGGFKKKWFFKRVETTLENSYGSLKHRFEKEHPLNQIFIFWVPAVDFAGVVLLLMAYSPARVFHPGWCWNPHRKSWDKLPTSTEQWRKPWLVVWYRGWNPTQLYRDFLS